jgi:hypothetical protein
MLRSGRWRGGQRFPGALIPAERGCKIELSAVHKVPSVRQLLIVGAGDEVGAHV